MEELTLHARQKKLLSILNVKHGIETGKELSARLGVSERTVRNDISEINEKLESYGIRIVPLYGKGYTLSIRDRAVYLELFSEKESYITKDDRIRTLLLKLLREQDWYDLGSLEDDMFVSRTTLENDIKTIRQRISAHHPYLQVQRRGNYIKVENNEIKRRDLLIRLYAENWDYDSRDGIVLRQDDIQQNTLTQVRSALKREISTKEIELDDFGLIYMVLAISIMYFRVKDGCSIRDAQVLAADGAVSPIVKDVLDYLGQEWQTEFCPAEYVWLSAILRQLQILNTQNYSKNDVLKQTDVICHHVTNLVLKQIEEDYEIDFTRDDKLFVDMVLHVQALMNGIIIPQLQNHVLGDELRSRYPLMGDIAHAFRLQLETLCEMELWRDEEDYLLPFLISAQRTLYREKRGKGIKAVVISHLNGSLTHFLMEQLRKYYGDVLDLRGPFPIYAKEKVYKEQPMLIFTTVRMDDFRRLFDMPVLTVSALLEKEDRRKIDVCLTKLKCQLLYPAPRYQMHHYIKKDLIYHIKNKESFSSVLDMMQEKLSRKQYIAEKMAVDPETDYYTVLHNGFIFLYVTNDNAPETVISLAQLERTLSWKHVRNIRTIMFMVLRPGDRRLLGWFYQLASRLSESPELLEAVMCAKTMEQLRILDEGFYKGET